jgi:hypothetical protein
MTVTRACAGGNEASVSCGLRAAHPAESDIVREHLQPSTVPNTMELHNYTLKFIFFAFFATFSAAFGWSSGVAAAQPNGLIKMLNDADRAFCRSLKSKCKARGKPPVTKRQKPIAEKPESAPPIPVQKPLVTQDVAASAPIPRAKPQSLQKQAALQPTVLPKDTQSGKVDKLASAPPLPTQRPVIAPKVVASPPIPRAKPQELQQQAVLIPRVIPKEALPSDDNDTCLQKLRAAGTDFTVPTVNVDNGKCYVQNPVNLHSIKAQKNLIKLPEGPLLNCKFALQFSKWLSESGAPILAAQLGTPLEKISTGPGFECRGRNGDVSAKISEHGFGNAIDITTLRMRGGKVINVLDAIDPNAESYAILHGLRASACGYFTTVLGPGSNAAHEKHFHFDLGVHGKTGNYRICE